MWGQVRSNFEFVSWSLKRCLSDAVFHAESNGGIFMSVSSLHRPEKYISKCPRLIFVVFMIWISKIGVSSFCKCKAETSLHNISSFFENLKYVDVIHLLLNKSFFLLDRRNNKLKIRDSHVLAPTFLHANCKCCAFCFKIPLSAIFLTPCCFGQKCRVVTSQYRNFLKNQ